MQTITRGVRQNKYPQSREKYLLMFVFVYHGIHTKGRNSVR